MFLDVFIMRVDLSYDLWVHGGKLIEQIFGPHVVAILKK